MSTARARVDSMWATLLERVDADSALKPPADTRYDVLVRLTAASATPPSQPKQAMHGSSVSKRVVNREIKLESVLEAGVIAVELAVEVAIGDRPRAAVKIAQLAAVLVKAAAFPDELPKGTYTIALALTPETDDALPWIETNALWRYRDCENASDDELNTALASLVKANLVLQDAQGRYQLRERFTVAFE